MSITITGGFTLAGGGWTVTPVPAATGTTKAIFGYGEASGSAISITSLVSNTGVVAADTTGVGTARLLLAATTYGDDKAIFGYGNNNSFVAVSMTNKVSNTGVVSADTTGVGTARRAPAATKYGTTGQAIFGYGADAGGGTFYSMTNLVSNTGVVSSDTTGVGTARADLAAAAYGSTGQAIFGYGTTGSSTYVSTTNLVSNTGVIAANTTGVGTARFQLAAATYGTDKAIFGFGATASGGSGQVGMTNLVSNTGVVATDTAAVSGATARALLAGAGYGENKAIFGFGLQNNTILTATNLVSNTGVVAASTNAVGIARYRVAAASYSLT